MGGRIGGGGTELVGGVDSCTIGGRCTSKSMPLSVKLMNDVIPFVVSFPFQYGVETQAEALDVYINKIKIYLTKKIYLLRIVQCHPYSRISHHLLDLLEA